MTTPKPRIGYKNVLRVVLSGAVSSVDTWNLGMVLSGSPAPQSGSGTELNAVAKTIGDAWVANVWKATGGILNDVGLDVNFTTVQIALYEQSGAGIVAEGTDVRTSIAGSASASHPAYVAGCVTLRTPAFGKAGRGRSYLPVTGAQIVRPSLVFQNASTWATAYAAFIRAVNAGTYTINGVSVPLTCGVWSGSQGLFHPITSVACDTVPDTQRPRQSKLVGSRSSVVI